MRAVLVCVLALPVETETAFRDPFEFEVLPLMCKQSQPCSGGE